MRFPRTGLTALLLMLGCGSATGSTKATFVEAQPVFTRAVQQFHAQHYQAALADFRTLEARYGDDATLLYNIANTLYRLQRYAEASRYFASCAAHSTELRELSLYNLGLSQIRLGNLSAARATLQPLAASAQRANIRALADAAERIARERQALAPDLEARFGLGYSSNVVALNDAVEQQTDGRASPFSEAEVSAATHAWGDGRRNIRLTASAADIDYLQAGSSSATLLAAGASGQLAADSLRANLDISTSWLDLGGQQYQTYQSAALSLQAAALPSVQLGLRADHYEERSDLAAGTAGNQWTVFTQLPVPWTSRWWLELRHEWNDSQSADNSPKRDGLRLLYAAPLEVDWSGGASLGWRRSDCPTQGQARIDERLFVDTNLRRRLSVSLSWLMSLRYERNDSSDASSNFEQIQLSTGLGYSFPN